MTHYRKGKLEQLGEGDAATGRLYRIGVRPWHLEMNRQQRLTFLEGRAMLYVEKGDGKADLLTPAEMAGGAYNRGVPTHLHKKLHELVVAEIPLYHVALFKKVLATGAFPPVYSFNPDWRPQIKLVVSERLTVPNASEESRALTATLVQAAKTAGCSVGDDSGPFEARVKVDYFLDDAPYAGFGTLEHLNRITGVSVDDDCDVVLPEAEVSATSSGAFRAAFFTDEVAVRANPLTYHKAPGSLKTRTVMKPTTETYISNE